MPAFLAPLFLVGMAAAAVPILLDRGMIAADDEVVLFNTGSGLKYVGMVPQD